MEKTTKKALIKVVDIALCGISIAFGIARIVQLTVNEDYKG